MRGQSDSRGNRTMLPVAFSDLTIIFHGEDNFVDIHPDARRPFTSGVSWIPFPFYYRAYLCGGETEGFLIHRPDWGRL